MHDIKVSTDVFARIWSLRQDGEESEDAIFRRVLWLTEKRVRSGEFDADDRRSKGLHDQRFDVTFPEGFEIERVYLGRVYRARVQNGQWVVEGISGRFSKLNELSRAIGTKTENAWANWFFVDEQGQRRPVSDLRDPDKITSRTKKFTAQRGVSQMIGAEAAGKVRWCDDVRSALIALGSRAPLWNIYREVEKIRRSEGRSTPPSLEEVVRKELEVRSSDSEAFLGEDWFAMAEGKGGGVWELRHH